MKTDLKVELFLIHQTYFADNHGYRAIQPRRRMNWLQRVWIAKSV